MRKPSGQRDTSRLIVMVLCALVFLWMLLLNSFTPYVADDYSFSFAFHEREKNLLHSLPQLLNGLAYHYMTWSGRVILKFFAQAFTMLPKAVFNVCNAAAYTALGAVIYTLARRSAGRPHSPALFVFIQLGLWFFSPVFGQTNLWMCGSCNYLWSTLGCLAFLLLCLCQLEKPAFRRRVTPAMVAAGFIAGALCENTSAGLLAALAALLLANTFLYKRPSPLWLWAALAGALAGYAFLLLAPGNYQRADAAVDPRPLLTRIAVRALTCCRMLTEYALPLLALIVFLSVLLWHTRRDPRALIVPGVLFVGAMGANFAMIGSPVYYERSTHGVLSMLTACAACLLARLLDTLPRRLPEALIAAACVPLAFSMVYAGYDIASYGVMDAHRTALIREQAAQGKYAESYAIACYTPYCAAYGLPELRSAGEDALILCRALYYDLFSLTATEVHTYPFPGRLPAYDDDMLTLLSDAQRAELEGR